MKVSVVWEFEWVSVRVIALAGLFDLDCRFMTVFLLVIYIFYEGLTLFMVSLRWTSLANYGSL